MGVLTPQMSTRHLNDITLIIVTPSLFKKIDLHDPLFYALSIFCNKKCVKFYVKKSLIKMSKKILRSDQFLLIAKFQFFISDLPKYKHFLHFSNREKKIENPI